MVVFDFALTGDGYWQLNECSHELSIHFLGSLGVCRTRGIEEQFPVDFAVSRNGPESQEIREERHGVSLRGQLIAVANLRVTVTIRRIGELERYESAITGTKPLRAFPKQLIYERL